MAANRLTGDVQGEAAPRRAAGGGSEVARPEEPLVGLPERRGRLLVGADQEGRVAQEREALAVQRLLRVGGRQHLDAAAPLEGVEELARLGEDGTVAVHSRHGRTIGPPFLPVTASRCGRA